MAQTTGARGVADPRGGNGNAHFLSCLSWCARVTFTTVQPCGPAQSRIASEPSFNLAKVNAMSFLKGRILYTEDDPDSRDLVMFILKRGGYEVTCAVTGTEA